MQVRLKDLQPDVRISAEEIHEGRDVSAEELRHTPLEYQQIVVGIVGIHAEGEAFVLDDAVYAHWAADAPTARDRFMVLRTIEEELMHARTGWTLLREVADLVDYEELVPYQQAFLEGFQHPTLDWAEHAALCALTDRVGVFQQEEQLDCSYLPYAEAIRTAFFPVEKRHAGRGRYWLRNLVETDDGRRRAQAAVDIWWPRALDMFGRSDSRRQDRYIYFRMKKRTNQQRREAYIEVVGRELLELGLRVPDTLAGRKFL